MALQDRSVIPGNLGPSGNPWRAVAAAMYEACGSPEIPGHSGLDVAAALGGNGPVSVEMLKALIEAVRQHVRSLGSVTIPVGGNSRIQSNFNDSTINIGVLPTSVAFDPDGVVGGLGRSLLDVRQVGMADWKSPMGRSIAEGITWPTQLTPKIVLAGSEQQPTTSTAPVAAVQAKPEPPKVEAAQSADVVKPLAPRGRSRRSKTSEGPPPSPEAVRTHGEFMQALRELWDWSGMSTRGFEETSKEIVGPKRYFAKSTVNDVIKRETMPEEALLAVILAMLLHDRPGERARWQAARLKAENGQRSPLTVQVNIEPSVKAGGVADAGETGSEQELAKRRGFWRRKG